MLGHLASKQDVINSYIEKPEGENGEHEWND